MRHPFGFHIISSDIPLIPTLRDKGISTYQIFLAPPQRLQIKEFKSLGGFDKDLTLIAHSPYVITMVKSGSLRQATMKHCLAAMLHMHRSGFKPIWVQHTGKSKQSFKDDYDNLKQFASAVVFNMEHYGVKDYLFTIESDAGNKEWSQATGLVSLIQLVKELNHPNIKVCFDTEHSFASGVDLEKIPDWFYDYVGVIHMNSIPLEVKLGSHLDRHSTTPLIESSVMDPLFPIILKAKERNIPTIMERETAELCVNDIEFCLNFIKEYNESTGRKDSKSEGPTSS